MKSISIYIINKENAKGCPRAMVKDTKMVK
jgi:hypothetical protein